MSEITIRFQPTNPVKRDNPLGDSKSALNAAINAGGFKLKPVDHSIDHGNLKSLKYKVGCVFLVVVVSMLLHAEIGRNDHRECAPHFIKILRVQSSGSNLLIWLQDHKILLKLLIFFLDKQSSTSDNSDSIHATLAGMLQNIRKDIAPDDDRAADSDEWSD